MLAGLAVGFRYEFVVFLPVALFMARRPQRGAAALGLGAGLAPTAWHVLTHYDAVWRDVGGRLGINGRQEADWLDWFAGGTVLVPSAAFALIVSAVLLRRQGRPARMVATSAALAVLGLPEAIQRIDYYHSMFIGIVTVPLAVAAVLLSRPAGPPLAPGSAGARRLRLIVGALVVGLAVSCTFLAVSAPAYTVERAGRSLYVTEVQQAEMRSVLRAVEGAAPAGSRLFVGADDMTLPTANENYYHLLLPDYPPAGRFTELAPGLSEKRGSGLEDDVRNAHVVILTRMDAAAVARNLPHLPRGDNPANEIIRREFTRVASFSYTEVWRRR